MIPTIIVFMLAVESLVAYPFVAKMSGVDSSLLRNGRHGSYDKRQSSCPFNPVHPGAAPYSAMYPYTGARNGLPGTGQGGILVPAAGDTAHAFQAPGPNDIRGPCPGLNTAANHHFLSHDGITTFTELVDAQQNLYNVGYDLAVTLATLGVSLDGDVLTGKVSLGCDATSRTAATGGDLLGNEPGINSHNRFEADTSLTRNDYFLAAGDDHTFNGTLFGSMQQTCQGNFDRDNVALYRYQRYRQSRADNGNFYFGPGAILMYGAASFVYELFPSLGPAGRPGLAVMESFFGAHPDANGDYSFNNAERIPPDWHNRAEPYSGVDVAGEISAQYLLYPVLFGGNVGPGDFDTLSFGIIRNGTLTDTGTDALLCLIYQLATEKVPSGLGGGVDLPAEVVEWVGGKLNPIYRDYGCPLVVT